MIIVTRIKGDGNSGTRPQYAAGRQLYVFAVTGVQAFVDRDKKIFHTALSPTAWKRLGNACSPSLACRRANGAVYAQQMLSSVCTKNSSDGSRLKLFCHPPTPPRCCSGRCSLQDRSTCARSMVGRRSPQNPLISRLTLPPKTVPSCYRRMRHTEFQPHSGRHPRA